MISTSYDGSSIAGEQITFEEYTQGNGEREKPKAVCIEVEEVTDLNGDGAIGIEDVQLFLENNPHSHTPLQGGGDFRSEECIRLLEQADIVVTNPPPDRHPYGDPDDPEEVGTIWINSTTNESYYWDGSEWNTLMIDIESLPQMERN